MTDSSDLRIRVYTMTVPNRTLMNSNSVHGQFAYRDISLAYVGILAGAGYVPNGEIQVNGAAA